MSGVRNKTDFLRVSAKSIAPKVAGAIVANLQEDKPLELQAVGASAVNQAVKAIAIARGILEQSGKHLTTYPVFATVKLQDGEKTAIKFIVNIVE